MARSNYFELVVDNFGRPRPGIAVTINEHPAGTPAVIWAAEIAGASATGTWTTDAQGFVNVWLDPGRYDMTPTGAGAETQVFDTFGPGPPGPTGPIGLIGPIGPPGVGANWIGTWSSVITYALGDGAYRNGRPYISNVAGNLNQDPATDSGANWGRAHTPPIYVDVTTAPYGADNTGGTDSTAAFNLALAVGSTFIPDGIYQINGTVTIPTSTYAPDFLGAGMSRVTLRLGASGKIVLGNRLGTGGIPVGAKIGGFTVNGNAVATGPGFYVGLVTQILFESLTVRNCLGDNFVVEAAQNCTFINCYLSNTGGNNLVLDYGCGGNSFYNLECYGAVGWGLVIRQSGASPAGVWPTANGPGQNSFFGGRFEQPGATTLANTNAGTGLGAAPGIIRHSGGSATLFNGVNVTGGGPSSVDAFTLVLVESSAATQSDITFDACTLIGPTGGLGTGIDIAPVTSACYVNVRNSTVGGNNRAYRSPRGAVSLTAHNNNYIANTLKWAQKTGDTPSVTEDAIVHTEISPPVTLASLGYSTGWSDSTTCKYQVRDGEVVLLGTLLATASAGATICTLPDWARPAAQRAIPVAAVANGAQIYSAAVQITAAGVVQTSAFTPGAGTNFVVLDNVRFLIGQ